MCSDNPFDMPLIVDAPEPIVVPGSDAHARLSPSSSPRLTLRKSSVKGGGLYSPVLTPCDPDQVVYNGIRSFSVDPVTRHIFVVNSSSETDEARNDEGEGRGSGRGERGRDRLCLRMVYGGTRVVTDHCGDPGAEWVLDAAGRIRLIGDDGSSSGAGHSGAGHGSWIQDSSGEAAAGLKPEVALGDNERDSRRLAMTDGAAARPMMRRGQRGGTCLGVHAVSSHGNKSVSCPYRSYYTDPRYVLILNAGKYEPPKHDYCN